MRARLLVGLAVATLLIVVGASRAYFRRLHAYTPASVSISRARKVELTAFQSAVLASLRQQVAANIRYQDGYYQGGEPPKEIGVCTDVVIRSFRTAGVDLKKQVGEDIRANHSSYHISRPDPNIDQRRCRNLVIYFRRKTTSLPPDSSWQPGDVVFWDTRGGHTVPDHVGMIADGLDRAGNPTIVHHWPGCPVAETDGLYRFTVVGHFRWQIGVLEEKEAERRNP